MNREDSYQVFFNRDELHTRGKEYPPAVRTQENVQYVAPLDSDALGTWCGVNEFGLAFCLMNYYLPAVLEKKTPVISRGLLLKSILHFASLKRVNAQLRMADLGSYLPFRILGFEMGKSVHFWEWDGKSLNFKDAVDGEYPMVSSSFRQEDVEECRKDYFKRLLLSGKTVNEEFLDAYHKSQFPSLSAYSVCMQRDDASTVSYSRIKVDKTHVQYFYEPAPLRINPKSCQVIEIPSKLPNLTAQ